MVFSPAALADAWSSIYANSAVLRTSVSFAHIAGLVAGGGAALVEDRGVLAASRCDEPARRERAVSTQRAHRVVVAGLVFVCVSGMLLFAADYEIFLRSSVFWLKMGLVAALLMNGLGLARAAHDVERGHDAAWRRLRGAATRSLALWTILTLLGAALPNV